jgi:hypothetical protein
MGGLELKTLKKLNGDKFGLPCASKVLAKAMGLGATAVNKYLCNFEEDMSLGLIVNIKKIVLSNKSKDITLQINIILIF